MAAKMECPYCNKVLKEEGDECKSAQGEYKVIESGVRQIECLACGFINNISAWSHHEINKLNK
jgi:Zn ribbon nucleic-acid-binding protein